MSLIVDGLSWFGAGALLVAYFLVSSGRTAPHAGVYQLLNLVGSVLVGANALYYRALPSFALNVIWTVIAIATLLRATRATPEESS